MSVSACGGKVVVDGNTAGTGGTTSSAGGMGAASTNTSTGTSTASTGASTGTVMSSTTSTGTATTTTSTGTASTGTASTGTASTGTASTGSGGICVPTCAEAAQTGLEPCMGLPFANYGALGQCVCGNGFGMSCAFQCGSDLCKHKAISAGCLACAQLNCPDQASACFGM